MKTLLLTIQIDANSIPRYRLSIKSYLGKNYKTNYGTFTPSLFVELGNIKLNENTKNTSEELLSTVKTKNN